MGLGIKGGRRAYAVAVLAALGATSTVVLWRSGREARAAPRLDPAPELSVSGRLEVGAAAPAPAAEAPARLELSGPGIRGEVALSQAAIAGDGPGLFFAQVSLETPPGDPREAGAAAPSVALALVLDTSGSMTGPKIEQARAAALDLVERMRDGDSLTLVAYDSTARTVVGLGPVGERRAAITAAIAGLEAGGGTDIPAALAEATRALAGAAPGQVRRVVLVSDGRDGSGLPLPDACALVRASTGSGATFSAIGVGADYDERFLTSLADAGRGNYCYLSTPQELARFLATELDEATGTAFVSVAARIVPSAGLRVRQVHGADMILFGDGAVGIPFGAMTAADRRRAVVELEVVPGARPRAPSLAASATCSRPGEAAARSLGAGLLPIRLVASEEAARASRDLDVYTTSVATTADARQAEAIDAWRAGRVDEALRISAGNRAALEEIQSLRYSPEVAARLDELGRDDGNFRGTVATSAAGVTYGLESNAGRRGRLWQQSSR